MKCSLELEMSAVLLVIGKCWDMAYTDELIQDWTNLVELDGSTHLIAHVSSDVFCCVLL
jgi:hypothetical protein